MGSLALNKLTLHTSLMGILHFSEVKALVFWNLNWFRKGAFDSINVSLQQGFSLQLPIPLLKEGQEVIHGMWFSLLLVALKVLEVGNEALDVLN